MSFSEKITTLELLISILKQNETQLETLIEKMEIIDKTIKQNPLLNKTVKEYSPSTTTDEIESLNILIVEYDQNLANNFKLILESVGYSVDVASTGLQSLYRVKQRSYNLIIIDLNLPDYKGDKIAEMIEKDDEEVNIVYISESLKNDVSEDREILLKPIDPENLLEVTSRSIFN
jgi:CheY-like chemotaxis protein